MLKLMFQTKQLDNGYIVDIQRKYCTPALKVTRVGWLRLVATISRLHKSQGLFCKRAL